MSPDVSDTAATDGSCAAPERQRCLGRLEGYFVIRRANAWLRVDAVPDYDLPKAALAR